MGLLDRFKKSMRDDITALAEDLADSVAAEWSHATSVLQRQGTLPSGRDLSRFIISSRQSTRERIMPLVADKEKFSSQTLLNGGLPETALELARACWEIEVETHFAPAHKDVSREKALAIVARTLARHGLVPEPSAESIQEMVRLSGELGQLVVERYRNDLAELGHLPSFDGELHARTLGCSTVLVAHGIAFGLTDWERRSQSIVGHVLAYAMKDQPDIDFDNLLIHGPTLQEFSVVAMGMIARSDLQLEFAYQGLLAKSCGGLAYLTEVRGSPELAKRFLHTSVAFVSCLLSIWYPQAKAAFVSSPPGSPRSM
jgi:hypothetical protein